MNKIQTKYEFLMANLSEGDAARLKEEYDRYAHGPTADLIAESPAMVMIYADAKHDLDTPWFNTSVATALNATRWSYSLYGPGFWSDTMVIHRDVEHKQALAAAKAEDDRVAAAAAESLKEQDAPSDT